RARHLDEDVSAAQIRGGRGAALERQSDSAACVRGRALARAAAAFADVGRAAADQDPGGRGPGGGARGRFGLPGDFGYEVIEAEDGFEALPRLQEISPAQVVSLGLRITIEFILLCSAGLCSAGRDSFEKELCGVGRRGRE